MRIKLPPEQATRVAKLKVALEKKLADGAEDRAARARETAELLAIKGHLEADIERLKEPALRDDDAARKLVIAERRLAAGDAKLAALNKPEPPFAGLGAMEMNPRDARDHLAALGFEPMAEADDPHFTMLPHVICRFQATQNLPADGALDDETRERLARAFALLVLAEVLRHWEAHLRASQESLMGRRGFHPKHCAVAMAAIHSIRGEFNFGGLDAQTLLTCLENALAGEPNLFEQSPAAPAKDAAPPAATPPVKAPDAEPADAALIPPPESPNINGKDAETSEEAMLASVLGGNEEVKLATLT
jgi:hypothetical protein